MIRVKPLEELSLNKLTCMVCLSPDMVDEVLCTKGSVCDVIKSDYVRENTPNKKFKDIITKRSSKVVRKLPIPKYGEEKIKNVVIPVARKILKWVRFHEEHYGVPREVLKNYLGYDSCTTRGLLDTKKIAQKMARDETVDILTRFLLACNYFLEEDEKPSDVVRPRLLCFRLWDVLSDDRTAAAELTASLKDKQNSIAQHWHCRFVERRTDLVNDESFWKLAFQKALETGNEVAARYCWNYLKFETRNEILIDSANLALKYRYSLILQNQFSNYYENSRLTFPSHYFIDIFCFLFLQMDREQKLHFMTLNQCQVFIYELLRWPYQDFVLENMKWFLETNMDFIDLVFNIAYTFEDDSKVKRMGEENVCNYASLLRNVWLLSPAEFKTKFFEFSHHGDRWGNRCVNLFYSLIGRKVLGQEEKDVINFIYGDAPIQQKENVLANQSVIELCPMLFYNGCMGVFDVILKGVSEQRILEFKRNVMFQEDSQIPLHAEYGVFTKLIIKGVSHFAEYVAWGIRTEEDLAEFTLKLRLSGTFSELVFNGDWEKVSYFLSWCHKSDDEVKNFKRSLRTTCLWKNCSIIDGLVNGGHFGTLDAYAKFLCSSSEKEILNFKRDLLLNEHCRHSFDEMYFKLLRNGKSIIAKSLLDWFRIDSFQCNITTIIDKYN